MNRVSLTELGRNRCHYDLFETCFWTISTPGLCHVDLNSEFQCMKASQV